MWWTAPRTSTIYGDVQVFLFLFLPLPPLCQTTHTVLPASAAMNNQIDTYYRTGQLENCSYGLSNIFVCEFR